MQVKDAIYIGVIIALLILLISNMIPSYSVTHIYEDGCRDVINYTTNEYFFVCEEIPKN